MKTFLTCASVLFGCMLSASAWAYTTSDCSNAELLASQGVISYKNNCRDYTLDRTITRQEVAAVTLKVGEICGSIQNVPPLGQYTCDNLFSDVSANYPNTWVCRVAETLARDGIISQNDQNQYGDIFFRPLKNITRAEALAMLLNGANLEFQGTTYDDWRFSGTWAVAWQKPLMQYAYDRDIIGSITTFGPNQNAYRRDVFNYATRALNLCRWGGNYYPDNTYTYGTTCGVGQYRSGNTCYSCTSLPWNGYYTTTGTCDWTCNSGYYKSGNTCVSGSQNYGTTAQCGVAINSCVSGAYYDMPDSGNYAYWNCTATNGTSVSCSAYNTGYYGTTGQCGSTRNTCTVGYASNTYDSGNYSYWNCVGTSGIATSCSAYNTNYSNCGVGQYYSGSMCLGCTSKPSYATYTTAGTCEWTCNSGYYKSGNTCVSSYQQTTCGVGQYYSGNTCYSCGTAPYNGYYTTTGTCDWACSSGYYKSGNTCVSSYNYNTCWVWQYYSGNTCYSCGTAPYNAYYTTTGTCDWTCSSGYYKSGNTCVSNYQPTTCGIGQYMSGNTCYSCGNIPANGYYTTTGTCDWTCSSGYYKSGNTCVSNYNYNYNYNYDTNYYNCPLGQHYYGGYCTACSTPSNAYCTTAGSCDWTCSSGYYRSGNTCIINNNYNYNYTPPYTTPYTNNCSIPMPSNAYYTDSQTCWSCNAGYVQMNNLCVWWN